MSFLKIVFAFTLEAISPTSKEKMDIFRKFNTMAFN